MFLAALVVKVTFLYFLLLFGSVLNNIMNGQNLVNCYT